ncbi:hypothetical protein [Geodermatophilus nigrescens]|uniref:YtxH-like protein n=1 Tax=Geodermatophilus nigrescens TaxID=1070870 RepID=A0A1M5EH92_9ACTN|nr:hypothetical protein [Geodermatophilus nigrescens]SHF78431.1 hypothetical protein SAMN05444351_0787 [Geodermatophilus nigrescens]
MGKLTLGIGLGIGYVLGARAGRESYERIVSSAQGLLGRPEVQQTLDKAREAAPAPLQSSIDKLASSASGGGTSSSGTSSSGTSSSGTSSSAPSSSGTASSGTASSGTASSGTAALGTPDVETIAEAASGQAAAGSGGVPDPLVPPAKSNGGTTR